MNNYETLKQMLTETNISFTTDENLYFYHNIDPRCEYYIEICNSKLFDGQEFGCKNYVSVWLFDKNGKLIAVGNHD